MRLARTIDGTISPKSVVASGDGHFIAQNMMYRHSITVYDRSYQLVTTISDRVDLQDLGGPAADGPVRGAPVEAAFSPDARYAYVSNYSMYGPGYAREGSDRCSPASAIDRSFVYRLDMRRLAVDRVGRVGQVPKYVAATPDGRLVLVTNWCSLSVAGPPVNGESGSWVLLLCCWLDVADRSRGSRWSARSNARTNDLDAGEGVAGSWSEAAACVTP
ncbi:MAG TPA: hypothetical protein VL330_17910 [Actinomycetes bacterium]|nr:hypothetical protein [Actinomycetes bacterium]